MASGANTADAGVGGARRGAHSAAPSTSTGSLSRGRTEKPEAVIARLHSSARRLILPVLLLIAIGAGTGYLYGNLPESWENLALPFVAATLTLFVVVFPYLFWLSRVYVITTRRVVLKNGFFTRERRELLHTRGYAVTLRRGPLQLIFGSGDIRIDSGADAQTVLRDVPRALLVQATLADLMENSTHVTGTPRQQQLEATRRPFDP